jgi:integrase
MPINIVAMTTGMRIGEIIALKPEDIGDKYIAVSKSYSESDGLKSTKTNEPRIIRVCAR